jgi:hypothetical protein
MIVMMTMIVTRAARKEREGGHRHQFSHPGTTSYNPYTSYTFVWKEP